ncbi:MAG: hypothetical protein J2P41_21415 [Blastocatellia bacterium]|nr:hypothetical protein [Blastocatellia bacterium]
MTDHLTNTQIESYGRHTLSAIESLSVLDHLAGCEECRQRLEIVHNDDEEYLGLKAELLVDEETLSSSVRQGHLTFEEMADLVDAALTGEELQAAVDYLSCCEQCQLAVNDLAAFRERAIPGFKRELRPSAPQTSAKGHRRLLSAALPLLRPTSPAIVFGSALVALLLVAVSWLVWHQRGGNREKPEITKAIPAPGFSPPSSPNPPESQFLAQLNDGDGVVAMDRKGRLTGDEHLPPAYQQMVERALATQKIERSPLLTELTRTEGSARGRGGRNEEFSVIEPLEEVTLSDRPAFRWSPLAGATGYVVEVFDKKLDLAAASPQITDLSWTPSQPLRRAEVYFWQVKAIKDGRAVVTPSPPARSAKFRVLDQARAGELARARRAYATSHLTLGLLYAQSGLLDEAERELRELQKANPDSEIARRLLTQVQEMRKMRTQ